jgi:hypothetical protein
MRGQSVRSHRVTGEDVGISLGSSFDDAAEICAELRVGIAIARRSPIGLAVPARVVGDRAKTLARQHLGAVEHVAASRGEPVGQDDRDTVSHRLPSQGYASGDRERGRLEGVPTWGRAHAGSAARASESAAARCSTSL